MAGLHELAHELRRFADDADDLDGAKVRAFLNQAQAQSLPGEKDVQAAIALLQQAGYKVS